MPLQISLSPLDLNTNLLVFGRQELELERLELFLLAVQLL